MGQRQRIFVWVMFVAMFGAQMSYVGLASWMSSNIGGEAMSFTWAAFGGLVAAACLFAEVAIALRYWLMERRPELVSQRAINCSVVLGGFLSVVVAAYGFAAFVMWREIWLMIPFTYFGLFLLWLNAPSRMPAMATLRS